VQIYGHIAEKTVALGVFFIPSISFSEMEKKYNYLKIKCPFLAKH
jgi:hypothetical protein